jgi:ABC-type nitrate/sulfonate/bicarbonate transport system substrate-binding protein
VFAVGAAVALLLAPSASGANEQARDKVVIGIQSPVISFSQVYLAKAQGHFEDFNLDVELKYTGATTLPFLLSGQVDLLMTGTPTLATAANSGAPTIKAIYNGFSGGISAYVAGRPDVRTMSDCRRVASTAVGTANWAWMQFFRQRLRLDFDIIPFPNTATQAASVLSGQTNCIGGPYAAMGQQVASGQLRWLINPERAATVPPSAVASLAQISAGVVMGTDAWLKSHRPQMVRLVKALERTRRTLVRQPTAVGALLADIPDLAPQGQAGLTDAYTHLQPFLTPFNGYFPRNAWRAMQVWLILGGSSFINPAEAKWNYDNFVDMSYYDAALAGTRTVTTTKQRNTLVKVAAHVFGDRTLWTRIYRQNRRFFAQRDISQARARTVKLRVGTRLRY